MGFNASFQAFRLCAVPGTGFNLSYESLTTHEARAAILNLRLSDPTFYAEITSGTLAAVSKADAEAEDTAIEAAAGEEEDSTDLTVPELCATLINATLASDLTPPGPTDNNSEAASDSGDDYSTLR